MGFPVHAFISVSWLPSFLTGSDGNSRWRSKQTNFGDTLGLGFLFFLTSSNPDLFPKLFRLLPQKN